MMMLRWGALLSLLIALLMATVSSAQAARSNDNSAPTALVGVVDLELIAQEYIGYSKAIERMKVFSQEREDRFNTMRQGLGLSTEQYEEYCRLAVPQVKVNADRIAELEKLAQANMTEFQGLRMKKDLNDEEKARMAALEKDYQVVSSQLTEEANGLSQEIQTEYDRYSQLLQELVNKAVAKTAESKKLAIAVSKNVRTKEGMETVVLWGGTDITADVVALLNNEFKDALLDPAKE